MKKWLKILFFRVLPVILVILFVGFSYYSSSITLAPKRRQLQEYHQQILQSPHTYGLSYSRETSRDGMPYLICEPHPHDVAKKSRELMAELEKRGVALAPWGQIRGTIIALHGHKGRKEDVLPICERFCAAGFRCLCPDLPAHGENAMPIMTFGKQEVPLLRNLWTEHLQKHPHHQQPLFFFGYSQGGAISLQAAADTTAWNAAGVASVNSFATLDCPILSSASYLPEFLRPLTALTTGACGIGIKCQVGSWPSEIGPLPRISQISCPTMIVHGEKDRFVPVAQGDCLFHAISHQKKSRVIVPNGTHGGTLATGSTALYADVCHWFLKAL